MKNRRVKKEYSTKDVIDSIDSLAVMTKKGFDKMVTKDEFEDYKDEIGMTLYNIDSKLRTVDERLDAIEKTMGPLVRISGIMQNEIRDLNSRVAKLEHKIGVK